MRDKIANTKKHKILIKFICCLVWILLWQMLCKAVDISLLLPSPTAVMLRLTELCREGRFWLTVGSSFFRILLGFSGGVLFGSALAVAAFCVPLLEEFVRPAMSVIKATPVASFIILALVWVHSQILSVLISFLMVLPIVFNNVLAGISSTDKELLEMANLYHIYIGSTIRSVYIPNVLPFFLSAITSAMGFAWKSGIAAEVLGHPAMAIGSQIYNAKIYLETTDLFAWTAVVIILSVLIEKAFLIFLKNLEPKIIKINNKINNKKINKNNNNNKNSQEIIKNKICLKNINISFGEDNKINVLENFSLILPSSGIVCLLAASGSGKTTLLRLISGAIKPDSGEITGLENRKTALMFQEDRLIEGLSAADNIRLVLQPDDCYMADEFLKELGLSGWEEALPKELSGGMKRRVALARTFAYGASCGEKAVYLLDEPLKGLDEKSAQKALSWINKHRNGALILFVTHNRQEAEGFADKIITL